MGNDLAGEHDLFQFEAGHDPDALDQAEQGEFPRALLDLIRGGGFQQLAMPSSGVDLADALAVLRVVGLYAVPLPLAEMLLANRWLNSDERLISIGLGNASGADTVPWGRVADAVISLNRNGDAWLLTGLTVEQTSVPSVVPGPERQRSRRGRMGGIPGIHP